MLRMMAQMQAQMAMLQRQQPSTSTVEVIRPPAHDTDNDEDDEETITPRRKKRQRTLPTEEQNKNKLKAAVIQVASRFYINKVIEISLRSSNHRIIPFGVESLKTFLENIKIYLFVGYTFHLKILVILMTKSLKS